MPHVSPLHLPHRCGTVRLRLQPRPFGRRRLPPNSVSSPEPAAASRDSDDKPHTDFERLAERLVKQSAGVQEGEHVLITGGSQDQELLENIAVHVHKVGAFPLVPLKATGMAKRLFDDARAGLAARHADAEAGGAHGRRDHREQ